MQARVRKEIHAVLETNGGAPRVTWSDRKRMSYTVAFMWETMRCKPVNPLSLMRCATEYLRISGYTNPCGTIVISSLWSIYDASFWGKGSCPGEAVANMVLFIYFTTILLHFVVEARPDDPAHECVESLGLSLRPSLRGLIFRPRRSDSFSDTMHDI
ncbi:hypothetical protein HPB52_022806 [Rhipicephalus sanguineus]|uniref:Uncharacterized protein n=1 Tax=Rhipicephalus sanguineus TaxID=34632 RepID=A0A9D4QEW5_RHISA|nr:hypothetical protein HPB52_022806 [Rhipicephalus sanguineus]